MSVRWQYPKIQKKEHGLHNLFDLLFYSGCRIGEALALNNKLLEFIEKYNILIWYEDKEFVLARKHIKDFMINKNILRARVNSLEIEKKIRVRELAEINRKISKANVLVKPEQNEDMVAHEVHNLPITEEKLEDYIGQKKNQLKKIKKLRKEIVRDSNSEIADGIAKKYKDYCRKDRSV